MLYYIYIQERGGLLQIILTKPLKRRVMRSACEIKSAYIWKV
ncbi:hypothetical protein JMA_12430 [Jeotgalibacillus malaysiensis]|uniref:Uncharacterized protein n=1 Tax=Jeotgalibacillus malaysiensis TaxID=1508404 RepID=A0A0B5AJN4_9BACL|nr:hypothetical protein JMA_12430 [Jeotgalibacillus malaysiensis]